MDWLLRFLRMFSRPPTDNIGLSPCSAPFAAFCCRSTTLARTVCISPVSQPPTLALSRRRSSFFRSPEPVHWWFWTYLRERRRLLLGAPRRIWEPLRFSRIPLLPATTPCSSPWSADSPPGFSTGPTGPGHMPLTTSRMSLTAGASLRCRKTLREPTWSAVPPISMLAIA